MPDRTEVAAIDVAVLPALRAHRFRLRIDADTPDVPIAVLCGHDDPRRLALVAGVHGDEADGIGALYELIEGLDLASLRGRLLIVPMANPAAFAAGQRRHPVDDGDLNRMFPGRVDGSASQRLAHRLTSVLLANCDVLFTIHGWHAWGTTTPHVEFDAEPSAAADRSRHMAASIGFPLVVPTDWPAGLLPKAAMRAGIPAIEAEIGGQGCTSNAGRSLVRARVAALMAHLGMTDGAGAEALAGADWRHETLIASFDGVFRTDLEPGASIAIGTPIGVLHDVYGDERVPVIAPAAGVLLVVRTCMRAAAGDCLAILLVRR